MEGFWKNVVFNHFANDGKTPLLESFLITLQAFSLQVFKKETPTQVLPCEVSKTFKSVYFEEHLQTTASGDVL